MSQFKERFTESFLELELPVVEEQKKGVGD